jgi:regulator of sigma E protease
VAGLREGDEILAVNGHKVYSNAQLGDDFISKSDGQPLTFTVSRAGQTVDLTVHPAQLPLTTPLVTLTVKNSAATATLDLLPIYKVGEEGDPAAPTTPAQKLLVWNIDNRGGAFGNLHPGDYLLQVNGRDVSSVQQVVDALQTTPAGSAPSLVFDSESAHETVAVTLPASCTAVVTPSTMITRIGITGWLDDSPPEHSPPVAQFSHAFGQIFGMLGALFNRHSDIGIQHLTGPIGMSRMIYQFSKVDVRMALWFAFIINVNLAILNLLPIPVLDGGHILFFTIARLRRRDLPLWLISTAQQICLVLIMSLALYVIVNDSRRWGGENDVEAKALHDSYYFIDPDNMKFAAPPAPPAPAAPPQK